MRKRIVCSLLILTMLSTMAIIAYFFLRGPREKCNLSTVAFLEVGMGYGEILDRLGQPDRKVGSGVPTLEYDLGDRCKVSLSFSGEMRLTRAWILLPSGDWEDLFRCMDRAR